MATRPSVVAKLRRSGIALDAHYLPPHASHPIQPKAMPLLRSLCTSRAASTIDMALLTELWLASFYSDTYRLGQPYG